MSNVEKRLAELEKGLRAADKRAKDADARAAAAERELKEVKARASDRNRELNAENRRLNTMRDLAGLDSPYVDDRREKIEELMKATVKTKDGRRHYYSELPSEVNGVYHVADSIISVPADHEPSVTWLPTKVNGKNPKTGELIFVPVGVKAAIAKKSDPSQEVEEGEVDDTTSNTELNKKAADKKAKAAERGPGAPPTKPTPPAPGANEPEGDAGEASSDEQRPADTDVG